MSDTQYEDNDAEDDPESVVEVYRMVRNETDAHPVIAAMFTPLVIFIAGLAKAKHEDRMEKKRRIQREERWRQEVRDGDVDGGEQ